MEQARYWMWTKRKHDLGTDFNDHVLSSSSHVHPSVAAAAAATASFGDSWEEQAFAEDAAGSLGGCVWPPRSYSCSFCRREFKSAQALGGHMNVHRRDRARLKQSPPNPHGGEREGENVLPQNHLHNNILNYNPQICTYLYKRNSDNSSSPPPPLPQPPPPQQPPIRVSALPPPDDDKTAPFLTSIIINPDDDDDDDREKHVTPEQSWSNFVSDTNKKKKSSSTKSSSESNLSVSLNLLLCRTQLRNASAIDGDKETTCQSSKRRRLIDASSFTLFPKSSEVVLKNIPSSSMEDLDLELRLGDPPKVK